MKNIFLNALLLSSIISEAQPTCGAFAPHIQNYIITYDKKWLCLQLADEGLSDVYSDDKKIRARITRIDSANKKDLDETIYIKWDGWHYNALECKYTPKYTTSEKITYKQLPCAPKWECFENCFNSKIISLLDSSIFIIFYLLNDFRNTYYIIIDKNNKIKADHIDLFQTNVINDDESYRLEINAYALKNYPTLKEATKGKSIWNNYSNQFLPNGSDDVILKNGLKDKKNYCILISDTTHHKYYKELTNTIISTTKWNLFLNGEIAFHQAQPLEIIEDKNYYYVMLYDWQGQTCYTYPDMIPTLYVISKKEGKLVNTINVAFE